MLHVSDQIPHFTVHDLRGTIVNYKDLWQRKNLLLLTLPPEQSGQATSYLAALDAEMNELTAHETAVVITTEFIEGLPCPGVVVADRWGEIRWIMATATVDGMPKLAELIEWLRFVQCDARGSAGGAVPRVPGFQGSCGSRRPHSSACVCVLFW